MAKKKHPDHWFCDTWQMNYWFFIGWDFEDFKSYMLKSEGICVGDMETKVGGTYYLDEGTRFVAIWAKFPVEASTVAHECLHAANVTLGNRGVRASFENDEAQAYLLTALMKRAWK